MMVARYCPKCKKILTSKDNFFCSSCGAKLSEDVIQTPSNVKVRKIPIEKVVKKGSKIDFSEFHMPSLDKKTLIYSGGLLVLLSILVVFMALPWETIIEKLPFGSNIQKIVIKEPVYKNQINLGTGFGVGEFGNYGFSDIVPASSPLFYEVADLKGFVSNHNLGFNKELISKSELLLENSFAGFLHEDSWTYLFAPKDVDITNSFIKDIDDEAWSFEIVNDLLVMYSEEFSISKVKDVFEKKELSLTLNPDYATKTNTLAKEGKMLVLFMKPGSKFSFKSYAEGHGEKFAEVANMILDTDFDHIIVN